MARSVEASTAVNDNLRCRSMEFAARKGDLPYWADRHMNASTRLVNEPVEFGCGVVAKRGAGSSAKDSGPKQGDPGRLAGEGGVDTPVERLPAAIMQLRVREPNTLASLGNLPTGDNAVLEFEQFLACRRELKRHNPTLTGERSGLSRAGSRCGQCLREKGSCG
jgi:hypothetical protein